MPKPGVGPAKLLQPWADIRKPVGLVKKGDSILPIRHFKRHQLNGSRQEDFVPTHMEHKMIGLTDDFPKETSGFREDRD